MQFFSVTLKHSNKTLTADTLLHCGSNTAIISGNVAQYLGLQGEVKKALSKTVHFNTKMVSSELVTDMEIVT